MSRKNKWPSAVLNNSTFQYFYTTLKSLAINRFEWQNLPDTCDARFLEQTLFNQGKCLFFLDEVTQQFYTLPVTLSGIWNIYNIPTERRAYAANGYNYKANPTDSVIIWNNYSHDGLAYITQYFAVKLYEIERAIDTNVKTQKFPAIIKSSEEQRLVMQNLMMQYDGNVPFIFADEALNFSGIDVLNLNAPYVAAQLFDLKKQYINEYLTLIGVENSNNDKKERMVVDEVNSNYGSIEAYRFLGLNAREQACDEINKLFGLNVSVTYHSVLPTMVNKAMRTDLYTLDSSFEKQSDIDKRDGSTNE